MVAGGDRAAKRLHLHLRNPASPTQLVQLRHLPWLHSLRLQHSHASIYSRHLSAIAMLTQLRELSLLMEMPKLELRSLAHQRLRRVPLSADCLSSLVRLERLELSCKAYTGETGGVMCGVCSWGRCCRTCWQAGAALMKRAPGRQTPQHMTAVGVQSSSA
jgi:hypothetical protein